MIEFSDYIQCNIFFFADIFFLFVNYYFHIIIYIIIVNKWIFHILLLIIYYYIKFFIIKNIFFFFKFFAAAIFLKFIFQRLLQKSPVENKVSRTQNSCKLLIVLKPNIYLNIKYCDCVVLILQTLVFLRVFIF